MFTIELSLSLLSLILISVGAGLLGFALRGRQLRKKQYKISALRREMIYNHSYILELEKENVDLELQLRGMKTPVLPLKIAGKEYPEDNRRVADASI
jgi:hypothetical protein